MFARLALITVFGCIFDQVAPYTIQINSQDVYQDGVRVNYGGAPPTVNLHEGESQTDVYNKIKHLLGPGDINFVSNDAIPREDRPGTEVESGGKLEDDLAVEIGIAAEPYDPWFSIGDYSHPQDNLTPNTGFYEEFEKELTEKIRRAFLLHVGNDSSIGDTAAVESEPARTLAFDEKFEELIGQAIAQLDWFGDLDRYTRPRVD